MGRTSHAKEDLKKAVIELIWLGSFAGTTIDDICQRAKVKKGSFYYFYQSKSALVIDALDDMHGEWLKKMNASFSPLLSGLDRLRTNSELCYEEQARLKEVYGRVPGCPLFTLGSECVTIEPEVTKRIQICMGEYMTFLKSAIRDAHAAGEIDSPDTDATAATLDSYWHGIITQARIQNDLEVLRAAWSGAERILRVKAVQIAAA